MAEVEVSDQLTLVELAKRTHHGDVIDIAEVLSEDNELFVDAIFVEANGTDSHTFTQRTSEPTGSWSMINKGIPYESSTTKQVVEPIAMLESYSRVDDRLLRKAKDKQKFRRDEDLSHVNGMIKTIHTAFFYSSLAEDMRKIDGVSTRYNALSDANVYDGGGSGGDETSIWLVQWGRDKVFLTYSIVSPTGTPIGFEDLGKKLVEDSDGNPYQAWVTHFEFEIGICIKDDRCIQRIANVEQSGTTNIFDEDLVIEALNNMPNRGSGATIYANIPIVTQVDIRAKDKTNVSYGMDTVFGQQVTTFMKRPVRLIEKLTDETTVT
jgi:hypothetical protein